MTTLSMTQTWGKERLAPLPIEFDAEAHRYTWLPTGERMCLSVTGVLSASKDARTLANFARTKKVWAPRGTYVHSCLEGFLKGEPVEKFLGTPYDNYVLPLLEYPLWEYFEPVALEYRVCDLRRNIGGSLDVLGYDHRANSMVLLDLKTLGKGRKPYSTDAQLGGYLSMLIDHHKLVVDECLTVWASPDEAHLGDLQPPDRCLMAWEDAYDIWKMKQTEL